MRSDSGLVMFDLGLRTSGPGSPARLYFFKGAEGAGYFVDDEEGPPASSVLSVLGGGRHDAAEVVAVEQLTGPDLDSGYGRGVAVWFC
jgi:hypothetical protein